MAGKFRPFDLPKKQNPIAVRAFYIDRYPVSRAEYLAFTARHPEWKRGVVPAIKADSNYLRNTDTVGAARSVAMTQISWYAARAYCASLGKRLPTLYEWEFVATYHAWDQEAVAKNKILAWFGQPHDADTQPVLGTGLTSPQGIHDLHGLIWEWVEDFNSSTVTGDSRADTDTESSLFCGATALASNNLRDYPAYMRYGMRSSLRGNYTGNNLGFRCARENQ